MGKPIPSHISCCVHLSIQCITYISIIDGHSNSFFVVEKIGLCAYICAESEMPFFVVQKHSLLSIFETKKMHFGWPNQNSKATFIIQIFPKYGLYNVDFMNLSFLGPILAKFQFCWFLGLFRASLCHIYLKQMNLKKMTSLVHYPKLRELFQ